MSKICYVPKNFADKTLRIIEQANLICDEYAAQGFTLTLRQLYYQFVSRDLIANKQSEYKRLGGIVNDARMAGLIDWEHLEDRTRNLRRMPHWADPAHIIRDDSQAFNIDKWANQRYRPEVWIEKDALVGVIQGVCDRNDVPYFSCRGYTSQSEIWRAGMRLARHILNGQTPMIFHLGDHDPSGIDMTRDILDRLSLFTYCEIEVDRLALTMDQINQYDPPPNPAKDTDARFIGYAEIYGDESWELDALEPTVLDALIQTNIDNIRDGDLWEESVELEQTGRAQLRQVYEQWDDVVSVLNV